ncbi:MAG: type II secretion system minor pseudopilin GspI [Gammaproteobacteria bacterium]|nr:type II secretion system minor pseudopilin GspI [Gammaproteobacteria bacterium]
MIDTKMYSGFTLIEVMLATAILSFALIALVQLTSQQTLTLSHLEKKAYASWVAENQLAEQLLQNPWPNIGITEGEAKMGGINWFWQITISNTSIEGFRRQDIIIAESKNTSAIYNMSSFFHQPLNKKNTLNLSLN